MSGSEGGQLLTGDAVAWPAAPWTWYSLPNTRPLVVSVLLQLALAALLGHANDVRIFMATGYLAGTGENPYVPRDLMYAFHHVLFGTRSTVGYPPPWPLLLGGIYRVSYGLVHQLLLYNLAIKLPIVAANAGLAYLGATLLRNLGSPDAVVRRAWLFLLFNPLLLYFTAAWGQIDGIAALLALAALLLLVAGRRDGGALLLAFAVCLKPVALPVAVAAFVCLLARAPRRAPRFALVFIAGALAFYVVPFFLLGWDPQPALRVWHKVWDMSGTLSYMTVLRLVRNPFPLPGLWWLLGLAWVPALAVAAVVTLRRRLHGVDDLLAVCTALVLVFFLTRTWLSEPNVVLLVPFALLLTLRGRLDQRWLAALWILPLAFTVAGWTPLQLLWVAFPATMEHAVGGVARYLTTVLWVRAALVVAWQVTGWWVVVTCLRGLPARIEGAADDVAVSDREAAVRRSSDAGVGSGNEAVAPWS